MRTNPDSIQMINTLAASVPHVASDMNFLDSVSTEWRLYQADADIYRRNGQNQQMAVLYLLMSTGHR